MAALRDTLRGAGRIRAVGRLPELEAYIKMKHGQRRSLTPAESAVMQTEVNAQMRVIRRNWPVRTGTSRAAWTAYIEGGPGEVSIVYINPVWYSGWITRRGQKPVRLGGKPWYQTLVTEVFKANKSRLIRKVREQIDKTELEFQRKQDLTFVGQNVPGWQRPNTGFGTTETFADLLARMHKKREGSP